MIPNNKKAVIIDSLPHLGTFSTIDALLLSLDDKEENKIYQCTVLNFKAEVIFTISTSGTKYVILLYENTIKGYNKASSATTWTEVNIGGGTELTLDDTPTANSNNPVTSQGIKTYVDNLVGNIETTLESI